MYYVYSYTIIYSWTLVVYTCLSPNSKAKVISFSRKYLNSYLVSILTEASTLFVGKMIKSCHPIP